MKQLEGDVRQYLIINTVEYNNDGRWGVTVSSSNPTELEDLGFDAEDRERIGELCIGDGLRDFDFSGVIVIRVA